MNAEVVLTPSEVAALPSRDLSDTVCIVFDVLRATSTILAAFANGARRIVPAATVEEARRLRGGSLRSALLAGERNGVRIAGFDLGNSPWEYTSEIVADRDIITTTTNGTVALRACAAARQVIVGAWVNTDALMAYLLAHEDEINHLLLVCAGTGEHFALEDGLAAGAVCACLEKHEVGWQFSDAALAMMYFYRRWSEEPLAIMRHSENGRRLIHLGLEDDVRWCAETDSSDWIAILRDGALVGECIAQDYKPYGEIFQRLRNPR